MLIRQKIDGVEINAYYGSFENGERGVLIMPWFQNGPTNSNVQWVNADGYINEHENGAFKPSGYVHTHPNYLEASESDYEYAKQNGWKNNYIIMWDGYLKINTSEPIDNQSGQHFGNSHLSKGNKLFK